MTKILMRCTKYSTSEHHPWSRWDNIFISDSDSVLVSTSGVGVFTLSEPSMKSLDHLLDVDEWILLSLGGNIIGSSTWEVQRATSNKASMLELLLC